jgi:hypothetical protein
MDLPVNNIQSVSGQAHMMGEIRTKLPQALEVSRVQILILRLVRGRADDQRVGSNTLFLENAAILAVPLLAKVVGGEVTRYEVPRLLDNTVSLALPEAARVDAGRHTRLCRTQAAAILQVVASAVRSPMLGLSRSRTIFPSSETRMNLIRGEFSAFTGLNPLL